MGSASPRKTKNGSPVLIFTQLGNYLYGAWADSDSPDAEWFPCRWYLNGRLLSQEEPDTDLDLNPERVL